MINLVPDPFPEEDVRETPEETEQMAHIIVSKRTYFACHLPQVEVEHVDE